MALRELEVKKFFWRWKSEQHRIGWSAFAAYSNGHDLPGCWRAPFFQEGDSQCCFDFPAHDRCFLV
jgi:hypothetical protein